MSSIRCILFSSSFIIPRDVALQDVESATIKLKFGRKSATHMNFFLS
jgi:hypothetical protein